MQNYYRISRLPWQRPRHLSPLTHAFGCPPSLGSIAHVHPNQHALSFLQINSNHQVVMYFANDGGIYRALDGYTGLITGTCNGSNQFDSLNDNLGSITQLVSFFAASHGPEHDSRRGARQWLARDQQLARQYELGERELWRRL